MDLREQGLVDVTSLVQCLLEIRVPKETQQSWSKILVGMKCWLSRSRAEMRWRSVAVKYQSWHGGVNCAWSGGQCSPT